MEPVEKRHGRRKRLLKGLTMAIRLVALLILPVLAGMCLRDPERCQEVIKSCPDYFKM